MFQCKLFELKTNVVKTLYMQQPLHYNMCGMCFNVFNYINDKLVLFWLIVAMAFYNSVSNWFIMKMMKVN